MSSGRQPEDAAKCSQVVELTGVTSWPGISWRGNCPIPRPRGGGPLAGQHHRLDPEEPLQQEKKDLAEQRMRVLGSLRRFPLVFGGSVELGEVRD